MKKTLAIFLTLIIIISTLFCTSSLIGSATESSTVNFTDGVTLGLSKGVISGEAIANGEWYITKNAGGTVTKSNNTVSFTGAQYQTMYTKLTGLTANTTYRLAFDVSPTMVAQVWLLSGDAAVSFTIDGTVPSGAASIGSINGTSATVEFTAEETSYYIFFRNALTTAGTTAFTFSNFNFEEAVKDDATLGETIADGDWKITKNAGGTVSHNKSEHTVSFTGAQYQTMYTKLTGLTANTTYKLTFDISPTMGAQVWFLSGATDPTFIIDGTVPNGAVSIGSVNGTSATVEFTAEEATHYIFFRNALSTAGTSAFTFSNFSLTAKEVGEPTGEDVAGGTWWSTRGATYTSSGNNVMWTSDPSWHSIYTELKGLKTNTKYEFTFEYNVDVSAFEIVWLYTGAKNSMALNGAGDRPAEYSSCTVTKKSGKIIATFTTAAEESAYCIGMKVANANGLILSNITFGKWMSKEVTADEIASGEWTLGEGGKSTTDLIGTDGWGKFIGTDGTVTITDPNSCRTSFTKVVGFVPNKEYELTFNATGIEGAAVVLENGSAYIDGVYQSLQTVSGKKDNIAYATADGNRYTVRFTAKNDYVYITVKNNAGTVTLSDFIFDPLKVSAFTEWGGRVTVSPSDIVAENTDVTFTANPNIGNYFVGWSDGENIVSTEKVYTVKAQNDISLIAIFDGMNISSDDIFAQRGYDGTFENGTIPGWYATHYNAADASYVSFCNYTVSSLHAYEGNKSLRLQAYHRCSILPLTNLNKNTDYRLSFYVLYEDNGVITDQTGRINANAILDSLSIHTVGANKIYANVSLSSVQANSGWYKVDMYFNTGDATDVNYELYYGSEDYATGCAYIDNMTLSEYYGNDKVLNADFQATVNNNGVSQPDNWMTNVAAATEGNNGVLKLENKQIAYQIINSGVDALYTVSFKAKGKVRAAAVDLAKTNTNITNLLSSTSYVDTSENSWNNYSFSFYSNNQKAVKLMFEGLESGALVDDVKLTKSEIAAGGIVEKIDFESERFSVLKASDNNFSIYKKASAKDDNVLSGNASLKFTPDSDEKKNRFIESYMSYQTVKGVSYTVTFNYKASDNGEIYLTPDIEEKYGVEQGYTYSLGKGWKKVDFHFTALNEVVLKAIMAGIVSSTKGDVYFDDINLKSRLPLIYDYNLENTYCDAIFNTIDYTGFEFFKENGNMGELSKGFNVVKSETAPSGNNIMTVKAGSKKIFAFNTKANKVYEFAVSLKGNAKTSGSVAVSVDANGKYYYSDTDEVVRSKITAPTNGEWKREAFSFITSTSGITYVVIECSSGVMEIDDIMLFESSYATLEDNNDYTIYKDYNFNNPPVKIYNGGFNGDGTFGDYDSAPATGDFTNTEFVLTLFAVSALLLLLCVFIKKRKGEHHV